MACQYKKYLFDINTGMNKIPSYRFYTGILPSSRLPSYIIYGLLQACINFITPYHPP